MTLSVVIPTLNASLALPAAVATLAGVAEIIVIDGGSDDGTAELAERLGAKVISAPCSRGGQLKVGAEAAIGEWMLFLHADTVLEPGWREDAQRFMAQPENRGKAAAFRFALDDASPQARRLERWVEWRVRTFGLPYGDQGLLIHRDLYRALGGFRSWPVMEDVDLVRRIERSRLAILPVSARTSSERWRRDGWRRRSLRNLGCLLLYFCGVPPRLIHRLYA